MQCPVDGTTLLMSERQGVEVDYCPECRGVWLDRGELDKILDRGDDERGDRDDRHERGRDWDRGDRPLAQGKKKRKGWLSDVFEFD